jgi:hypothetical protein
MTTYCCRIDGYDIVFSKDCSYGCLKERTLELFDKEEHKYKLELYNTYLLHQYIDFIQLPIAVNKYILSFVDYGSYLNEFIENYYIKCYKYKNYKTLVDKIRPCFHNINYVSFDEIVVNYWIGIGKKFKRDGSIIDTFIHCIFTTDDLITKYNLIYNLRVKNEHFMYIRNKYEYKIYKLIINAAKQYNYNLLRKLIVLPCVKMNLVMFYININYMDHWKVMSLLHMTNSYDTLNLINLLLSKKNIHMLRYIFKNKLYKSSKDVILNICWHGVTELLNDFDISADDTQLILDCRRFALKYDHFDTFLWFYYKFGLTLPQIYNLRVYVSHLDDTRPHIRNASHMLKNLAYNLYGECIDDGNTYIFGSFYYQSKYDTKYNYIEVNYSLTPNRRRIGHISATKWKNNDLTWYDIDEDSDDEYIFEKYSDLIED